MLIVPDGEASHPMTVQLSHLMMLTLAFFSPQFVWLTMRLSPKGPPNPEDVPDNPVCLRVWRPHCLDALGC